MRPRHAVLAPLLASLLGALIAGHADADARAAEGRFFHERGAEEYARGRYGRAVEHFLTAYRASPNPRALFNLAMAARRAHQSALAFTSFEEFLASDDDDAERRATAASHRDALRAELALVHVRTEPPGATLYLGRRERGIAARSPALLPVGASGEVTVMAELEGHHRAEATVVVQVGATAELTLALRPRTGRLEVAVQPASATVSLTVEGTDEGVAIDPSGELPVGRYRLHASAPGYRPGTTVVEVRADASSRAALTLGALPRPTGRLLVDGAPGAPVEVDGRVVGTLPVALPVSVGEHEVRVARDGFRRTVEVSAARPTYLHVAATARAAAPR